MLPLFVCQRVRIDLYNVMLLTVILCFMCPEIFFYNSRDNKTINGFCSLRHVSKLKPRWIEIESVKVHKRFIKNESKVPPVPPNITNTKDVLWIVVP